MAVKEHPIKFHFLKKEFSLSQRRALKEFILGIAKKHKKAVTEINYIFCDDDYLLNINQQYLKHDFYTDIITFELSTTAEPIQADIYISIDRVKENSKQYNSTFKRELERVIFHGLLHLVGYSDKKKKDQNIMRRKEDELIKLYNRST